MSKLTPTNHTRRSFVYRKLSSAGVTDFAHHGNTIIANAFTETAKEQERAKYCGLIDFSPLSRIGFKGAGAPEWLDSQGVVLPNKPNQSLIQDDGSLVAQLSETEILILGNPLTQQDNHLPQKLYMTWNQEVQPPIKPRGYPLLRQDSHAWFMLCGENVPQALAKLCGVDLRTQRFSKGSVAQTILGGVSTIIIHSQIDAILHYHLLVDSSYANYLFDHLVAVSKESGGGLVGLATLKSAL